MEVNITGLMVKPIEKWELLMELVDPKYFWVNIIISPELLEQLTETQITRLRVKLELVKHAAQIMAAGMLKGTLKYPTDDYSVEQWVAHLIGEGADQMNYQLLLADAYLKSKKPTD